MTNQEIVARGRDQMDATDAELAIARRRVAATEETAVKTAAQLKKQTDQMQNVASDLNEIEFTMKRAGRVITDITRGLATDKCALFVWNFKALFCI
jgi:SNARE protein